MSPGSWATGGDRGVRAELDLDGTVVPVQQLQRPGRSVREPALGNGVSRWRGARCDDEPVSRYTVVGETSTVVVSARSSMGPIAFEATGLEGEIDVEVRGGGIDLRRPVSGRLVVPVARLTSGKELFDAELARRIDARVHPTAELRLSSAEALPGTDYLLAGSMRFHGVENAISGTVALEQLTEERIVAVAQKAIDIRDFKIPPPTLLLLKIYPEVNVTLLAEAVRSGGRTGGT